MKTKKKFGLVGTSILTLAILVSAIAIWVVSCSKDNTVEPLTGGTSSGSDIIDSRAGGTWAIDKVHCNVGWSTAYYGDNAMLTGRFNMFDIKIYFDEQTPSNTTISAWVQLSTFNTGEPGRDAYGKCGPGYMGVIFDTIVVDPLTLAPEASTDTAWFNSTSVERYGDGYLAKGDLIFHGVTKSVDFYFNYEGQHTYSTSSGDVTKCGFSGSFDMNAITDFGVTSTSIADLVTITVNGNYKKL